MIIAILVLTVLLAGTMVLHALEREHWTRERAQLLQRIQAPELAVVEHAQQTAGPDMPAVPFDNDDEFWKTKGAA